jgi:hypothetical protein
MVRLGDYLAILYNLCMFGRHELTCRRCGGSFSAVRIDAGFCSRRCRRSTSAPVAALPTGNGDSPAITSEEAPAPVGRGVLSQDDLDAGWRVVGGYIVPPRDPALTFRVDDDWLR